jgi:hypothetical protein
MLSKIVNGIVLGSTAFIAVAFINSCGIGLLKGLVSTEGLIILIAFSFMEIMFVKM